VLDVLLEQHLSPLTTSNQLVTISCQAEQDAGDARHTSLPVPARLSSTTHQEQPGLDNNNQSVASCPGNCSTQQHIINMLVMIQY